MIDYGAFDPDTADIPPAPTDGFTQNSRPWTADEQAAVDATPPLGQPVEVIARADPRDDPTFERLDEDGERRLVGRALGPSTQPARVNGPYRVLDWKALLEQPPEPPPQICAGVPAIGVTVLAGSPKVGKSLLSSQRAIETGRPCLLIIEEGSLAGISYRLRRQAEALGVDEPAIHVMHRQRVRLDRPSDVKRIRQHVAALRPALVIVDPLNRLHGADENRPSQMTPIMDSLASIAYEHETAVLAVHHLAKPSAERRGDIWDRFRGAGAIRSGTDANLALDGSGEHVKLIGEFRDAEPLMLHLVLDRESLTFRDGEAPQAPAKVNPIDLREWVQERGQVTAAQVCERFEVVKTTALSALRALGCDEYEGPRRVLTFTLGTTVQ